MSYFPCSRHSATYRGPSQTIYPALVNGSTTERQHRRLCGDCFNAEWEWLQMFALEVSDGTDDAEAGCYSPGCSNAADTALFATVYPRGKERVDYYARLCAEHSGWARAAIMATQLPLSET